MTVLKACRNFFTSVSMLVMLHGPLLFGALSLLASTSASAATNATTCSYADVSNAVSATAAGGAVNIPAGDCDWGVQQLSIVNGISLQGAGPDKTILRRNGLITNISYLISYNCSDGRPVSFSGIALVGNGNGNGSEGENGLGLLNGCVDFKVFKSSFSKFIFGGIWVSDASGMTRQRGVIFNNRFVDNFYPSLGYGVVVFGGGNDWPANDVPQLSLGSQNAVFVEDNYFSGNRHNIASNNGSVYVFRYNTAIGKDVDKDYAMTDAHGRLSWPRGSLSFEIYNNNYLTDISSGHVRSAVTIRGGNGVIFGNAAPATIARTVELTIEGGVGCGTWPVLDQIRSLHIWGNSDTHQIGYNTVNGIDNGCPATIVEGRDFDQIKPAAYQPYQFPHPLSVTSPASVAATSCNYSDVLAAVASAQPDTVVHIPSGDCNWGAQQLNINAGVYLKGAGQDQTIIRRADPAANGNFLISYDCANGRKAIFSDMTLVGNGNSATQENGLGLRNGCVDFKVHDAKFTAFGFSGIWVGDAANSASQRGVIYNSMFVDNFGPAGYGVVVFGGGTWPALDLGSKNAVFVEDSYFYGNGQSVASNNGSSYVFRFNTVVGTDPAKNYKMTNANGISTYWTRGSRSYEVYNNSFSTNISSGLYRTAAGVGGGDGVIFNNTATATISRTVELNVSGFACGNYPGADQIRSLYIWNNSDNSAQIGYTTNGIDNTCPSSIGLNRDYFLTPRPGYVPYLYPHPLRAN